MPPGNNDVTPIGAGIQIDVEGNLVPVIQQMIGAVGNLDTKVNQLSTSIDKLTGVFDQNTSHIQESIVHTRELSREYLRLYAAAAAGQSLYVVGKALADAGRAGARAWYDFGKAVLSMGSVFESYRAQLMTLFKDNEALVEEELKRIQELARVTPFTVGQVVRADIDFRAVGIDPFQLFEDRYGNMRELILFAGDLAGAMGKTIEDAIFSIKEAASGDWRSMKFRFNISKEQIEEAIGRTIATGGTLADIQDRIDAVVSYIRLKFAGGMEKLAQTTEGLIARLTESWELFLKDIGDAGFRDTFKNTLRSIIITVEDANRNGALTTFARNLSDIFTGLWTPIDRLAKVLPNVLRHLQNFAEYSNTIFSFLAKSAVVISVGLVGAGTLIAMFGQLIQTVASFALLFYPITATVGGKKFEVRLIDNMRAAFFGLTRMLLRTTFYVGLLYFAWTNNFMGIRDSVIKWYKSLVEAWKLVQDLRESRTIDEYRDKWEALTRSGNELAMTMERIAVTAEAIAQAFFATPYTLTESTFQRLQTVGMLDFVSNMLDLRARLVTFLRSMSEGLNSFGIGAYMALRPIIIVLHAVGKAFLWLTRQFYGARNVPDDVFARWGNTIGHIVGMIATARFVNGLVNFIKNMRIIKELFNIRGNLIARIERIRQTITRISGRIVQFYGIIRRVFGFIATVSTRFGNFMVRAMVATNNALVRLFAIIRGFNLAQLSFRLSALYVRLTLIANVIRIWLIQSLIRLRTFLITQLIPALRTTAMFFIRNWQLTALIALALILTYLARNYDKLVAKWNAIPEHTRSMIKFSAVMMSIGLTLIWILSNLNAIRNTFNTIVGFLGRFGVWGIVLAGIAVAVYLIWRNWSRIQQWWNNLSPVTREFLQIMGTIFGVLTGVGVLVMAVQKLVTVLNTFSIVQRIAAAATWLFNSALLANPITWIILAVIALVGAIILLIRHWDTVTETVRRWWNTTMQAVQTVLSWFDSLPNWLKPAFAALGIVFAPFVTLPLLAIKHWDKLKAVIISGWEKLKSAWNWVKEKLGFKVTTDATVAEAMRVAGQGVEIQGAASGGYLPKGGLIYTHPGEVIVNAPTVKRFDEVARYLEDVKTASASPVVRPDVRVAPATPSVIVRGGEDVTIEHLEVKLEFPNVVDIRNLSDRDVRMIAERVVEAMRTIKTRRDMTVYAVR